MNTYCIFEGHGLLQKSEGTKSSFGSWEGEKEKNATTIFFQILRDAIGRINDPTVQTIRGDKVCIGCKKIKDTMQTFHTRFRVCSEHTESA